MKTDRPLVQTILLLAAACFPQAGTPVDSGFEEFCLQGAFDLGARLQGRLPGPGERYLTRWCVVSSPDTTLVRFDGAGRSNPDMEGSFTVSYLGPDRVRLVNVSNPPDVEFIGTWSRNEAAGVRRLDPVRLVGELDRHPEWVVAEEDGGWIEVRWPGTEGPARVRIVDGQLLAVSTVADLPLRGRVPVTWNWSWEESSTGRAVLLVDGDTLFQATGSRRQLTPAQSDSLWRPSGGQSPRQVPGKAWPSVVSMQVETVSPGVHLVRGVRTGFHHLVVETRDGLIVADAPAGWVELHQVPAADMVPGLGVSGLSERFVDFLRSQWSGVPIRAVVLTHGHDDHAGGARAFAAAGAEVWAPAEIASFLESALNRAAMPEDRLTLTGRRVMVRPVAGRVELADPERPVELIAMGPTPHVDAAVGVHVRPAQVFFQSDLHVPSGDEPAPREDRVETECWFARWAAERLPSGTTVHNSHGSVALTVERLRSYLSHASCEDSGTGGRG